MSWPGHMKLTLPAFVMFSCLTRFHAYLLAGAESKNNTGDLGDEVGGKDEIEVAAKAKGKEEGNGHEET